MSRHIDISLIRKGDADAFTRLCEQYSNKLYRFAFSYLKNELESEEIVQEVFLKIWQNRSTLRDVKSLQSYLFTIAFNDVKKAFLRRSKAEAYKHEVVDELDSHGDTIDFEQRYQNVIQKLELFIEEMPERRRQIFIARKKEGKAVKQIAEEMEISVKTIENQITKAMKYQKCRFEDEMPDGVNLFYLFLRN
ncbi:RNA polymerase sigma factor [Mangrovibacterium sp.]|uniref:RNA polymerase sigma factor n=1 Tax=Mangrovibacterium sp. TaxID=1961364 RepID=UPI003562FA97